MKVYPMRRKDRQAGEEDILRILKENVYGVLSTISEDGWPYGVPVSYVYEEGLGEKWKARAAYWAHPTEELRESFKSAFRAPAVTAQYMGGEAEGSVLPDHYPLDLYYMSREGEDEIQSDLIYDYRTNVAF